MKPVGVAIAASMISASSFAHGSVRAAAPADTVPTVRCSVTEDYGHKSFLDAPPKLPSRLARRLAYYTAGDYHTGGHGVLAPRGWRCLLIGDAGGVSLYVTPQLHGQPPFQARFDGPAIQLTFSDGGTQERLRIAELDARLFPSRTRLINRLIADGFTSRTSLPKGPFPADRLKRVSPTWIEFTTPGNADGLGTVTGISKNTDPIEGFVRVVRDAGVDSTVHLLVRLPATQRDLARTIIAASEVASVKPRAVAWPSPKGTCFVTRIKERGPRLEVSAEDLGNGTSRQERADILEGSGVLYADGRMQVSYLSIFALDRSFEGDPVRLCITDFDKTCRPADGDVGYTYAATNLRTGDKWELPENEHFCR